MLYSREMLRLATCLSEFPLMGASPATERRAPVCGSIVAAEVALDSAGHVSQIGLKVAACAFGQASAALLALHIQGRTIGDVESTRNSLAAFLSGQSDMAGDWPGLDIFSGAKDLTARHGAILLPFDAAIDAMKLAKASSHA